MNNHISQTVPYQEDTIFSPFKASRFNEALDFLKRAGFTGVELAIAYPRSVDPETLQARLKMHDLTATTISTGQIYALKGLFLSSNNIKIRNDAISVLKGHIDLSVRIGKPPVTIGLMRGKLEQGPKEVLLDNLRESLLPCYDYAAKAGVVLQIEPINSGETVLLNTVPETLDFIASLGNPENAGILYDTYHSNIADDDMVKAITEAGDRITNVHLADSDRGLPGYGEIDFAWVCLALRSVNYNGAFALETLTIPNESFISKNCYRSVVDAIS